MPYPFLFKPLNLLKYLKVQMQLHQIGAKHLKVNGSRSILVQVSEIHKPYGQIFVGLYGINTKNTGNTATVLGDSAGSFRHNRAREKPKSRIAVQSRAPSTAFKKGSHFCA